MGLSHFFFFNDTATTEIYPLSLHDALPISQTMPKERNDVRLRAAGPACERDCRGRSPHRDGHSTRVNTSHTATSDGAFCLKNHRSAHSLRGPAGSPSTSHPRPDRQTTRVAP